MKLFDIFFMGLRNLWRRKMRTSLTILGVVIGTASIVVMVSLGIGMDESFKQQLERMGSLNIITVDPNYIVDQGNGMVNSGERPVLDDKAIATISSIPDVEAVMPIMETWLKLVSNKYVAPAAIVGTDIEMLEKFDFKTSQGRLPTKTDINAVVVGSDIPRQFYNPKAMGYYGYGYSEEPLVDVMNDKLELTFDMSYGEKRPSGMEGGGQENQKPPKLYKINCVGILEESQGDDRNYKVYMDINMYQKLIQDNNKNQRSSNSRDYYMGTPNQQEGYQQAKVKVTDINKVDKVQEQINKLGFGTYSLADIRRSMQEQSRTIQMILGGIGAVSLFVASIGITNTMIMSIYERTREIGIMKVLGCRLKDIRRTFLVEAAVIGLLGGALGIGLSYGVSFILNHFAGGMSGGMFIPVYDQSKISVIPAWLALSSIVFASCIGLISGLYPAQRAMKLSALEAIRTE